MPVTTAEVLCGMTLLLLPLLVSCGKSPGQAGRGGRQPAATAPQRHQAQPRRANSSANRSAPRQLDGNAFGLADESSQPTANDKPVIRAPEPTVPDASPPPVSRPATDSTASQTFPDEAGQGVSDRSTDAPPPTRSVIEPQRFAAANIRKLEGIHLTLYTDVPSAPAVDELPKVFDLAVEPWCKYFRVDRKNVKSWKMTGYLMERRERFADAGLLPTDLPPFLNGYQRGGEVWVYEQPSDYSRRHLLLHEGTHAFMQWQLKGAGPPWYMEGLAELMGTHRWQDGQLQLAYFPRDRQEVDHWGRIKMVRTEYDEGRGLSLEQIAAYGPTAHLRNEPYGWCWGSSAFLDGHPDYSRRFRQLASHVRDSSSNFAAFFQKTYAGDRRQLDEQWQLFVVNLDYGYDLQREAIVYEPVATHGGDTVLVTIRADRGWQSTGIQVQAGSSYVLRAEGRYQIDNEPKVWWCEPGGVTIRYHQGLPLGMLVAAVSDQTQPLSGVTPLARPEPIGLEREIQFPQAGTLFLRINDSPAQLADNVGQLSVEVQPRGR